jgi:hypothetical protein
LANHLPREAAKESCGPLEILRERHPRRKAMASPQSQRERSKVSGKPSAARM